MAGAQDVHFFAGERMADHDRVLQADRIHHAHDVVGEAYESVAGDGCRGSRMTAPGHADDAVAHGELRRHVIEHVRRIAQAGQKEQGRTGTAPVEHFQPHIILDGDERCLVR